MNVDFSKNKKTFNVAFEKKGANFNPEMTSGGFGGDDGATFIPSVSPEGILSWTNDKDLPNPDPVNIKGEDGKDGKDGYTPVKGVDYFDGNDGRDGTNGKDGYTPVKGKDYFDGEDGKDGYTPIKGKDYFDGQNGKDGYTPIKGVDYFDGEDGKDGTDGKDGKTPVKGTDYFTEADKSEMVQAVVNALPVYDGEVIAE